MPLYQLSVVLLRLAGILIVSWSLKHYVAWAVYLIPDSSSGIVPSVREPRVWHGLLNDLAETGIGVALVLRAASLARLAVRGCYPEGFCQCCGYNLAAGGLTKCPECGDLPA